MIQTNRLIIRPVELDDVDVLYQWWNDSDIMQNSGYYGGAMVTKTTITRYIESLNTLDRFQARKLFIIAERQTGHLIGEMSYFDYDPVHQFCSIDVKITDGSKQQLGIGYEASEALVEYLFKQFNLNRIQVDVLRSNKVALSLFKKIGFTLEGVSRKKYFNSTLDQFEDVVMMGILKTEYKQD